MNACAVKLMSHVRPVSSRSSSHCDHSVVSFDHVRLPFEALLGSLDMPKDLRQNFLQVIWRVGVGSLAFSNLTIAALKTSSYIAGRYSLRRTVNASNGSPVPIITFRAQQSPIIHGLAQVFVLDAFGKRVAAEFTNPKVDPRVRHGVAATLKAVLMQHSQNIFQVVAGRCGAQGLFEFDQIMESQVSCPSRIHKMFLS